MFSGITRGLFEVVWVRREPSLIRFGVDLGAYGAGLELGASVSIDGVCQTVVGIEGTVVAFDVIQETLDLTTLDTLEEGRLVSVERSVRVGDEIGGHEVSGHILGRGIIQERIEDGHDVALWIEVPTAWMRFLFAKGFVAIDGSSLTIGRVKEDSFSLHLVPETLRLTALGTKPIGAPVNVELDARTVTIVETVERILAASGHLPPSLS